MIYKYNPSMSWIFFFGIFFSSVISGHQVSSSVSAAKRVAVLRRHSSHLSNVQSLIPLAHNPVRDQVVYEKDKTATSIEQQNQTESTQQNQSLQAYQQELVQHIADNVRGPNWKLETDGTELYLVADSSQQSDHGSSRSQSNPNSHTLSNAQGTCYVDVIPAGSQEVLDAGSFASSIPEVATQQLAQELQNFSKNKAQEHDLRLKRTYGQRFAQRIRSLNAILENRVLLGFNKHSENQTVFCKSLTVGEWQAITNGQTVSSVINAPYLLQYDNYREMIKALPQYTKWVTGMYLTMLLNKAEDARWCEIPNKTRNYIHNEGKKAYIDVATKDLQALLKDKPSILQQGGEYVSSKIQSLHEQGTLLAQSGTAFHHEVHGHAVLSKTLQAIQALKSKHVKKITFTDYYNQVARTLGAAALQSLENLGITKAHFLFVGNGEQHLLYKKLFIDSYEIIARLATSTNLQEHDKEKFTSALKAALVRASAGVQATLNGDVQGIEKNFSAMQSLIGYAHQIESGLLNYRDAYNSATIEAALHDYKKREEVADSKIETNFAYSSCFHSCVQGCQDTEKHTYLRENNEEAGRLYSIESALSQVQQGNHAITHTTHTLSFSSQQALKDAHIPSATFQECVGNAYDHELHNQACKLVERASALDGEFSIQRAASLEAAYDSIIAHQTGNLHQAQQILDAGYELSYLKNNAVYGAQSELSHEAAVRYAAKAVELCCDLGVGFGKGVLASALRTVNFAVHPTELLKDIANAFKTLKDINVHLVEAAADIALIHLPGVSRKHRKEAAIRIVSRGKKYAEFIEQAGKVAQNISIEDVGAFVGGVAFDSLTGKAIPPAVGCLARQSKGLFEVVKKSEQLAEVSDALSKRYKILAQKFEAFAEQVKSTIGKVNKPNAALAGVPGNAGMGIRQAGQLGGAGKQVASIINYTMDKFLSASKTVNELILKHGPEITRIIDSYSAKCKSIGLSIPDIETFQHIISGHMEGGSRLWHAKKRKFRSVFNKNECWLKLGIEAWEKGVETSPGMKVFDVGRTIGKSLHTGQDISKVVVISKKGRLITVYPLDLAF